MTQNLDLQFEDSAYGAEQLDSMLATLIREFGNLGATAKRPRSTSLPDGAKGDPVTLAALALVVVPTLLPKAIEVVNEWLVRAPHRRVRIKAKNGIEVEFTSDRPIGSRAVTDLARRLSTIR